jgi:LPXTG-site transpeptidase (sortase) family protein
VGMKKLSGSIFTVVYILGVFVLGAVIGVGYSNQIGALFGYYTSSVDVAPVPTLDPVKVVTVSTISLPSLVEPFPLVYSDTLEEKVIQEHLKEGAVVLPLGTTFGESGNVVVTAHSSGTKSFGPYRFAFSKLSELEEGMEYTVETLGNKYRYRVYGKEIVWPTQVDRLPNDERSTVTLVTCWPLWTNFKRLLVHSELVGVEYNI